MSLLEMNFASIVHSTPLSHAQNGTPKVVCDNYSAILKLILATTFTANDTSITKLVTIAFFYISGTHGT